MHDTNSMANSWSFFAWLSHSSVIKAVHTRPSCDLWSVALMIRPITFRVLANFLVLYLSHVLLTFWNTWICSWHDRAMLFEQYHWKKAMEKKQPYEFLVYCLTFWYLGFYKFFRPTTDDNFYSYACYAVTIWKMFSWNFTLLQWNQRMDKDHRDSYYFNWPVYFP